MLSDEIATRARQIKLILTDCDGVLTDGSLYYTENGEAAKVFHIHDGLAFKLAQQAGIKTGIISGRKSSALELRARELSVDHLYHGNDAKLAAYEEIRAIENVRDEQIAYLGDDLHDLELLHRVGLAIAVADAVAEVKAAAHFVTTRNGGRGAFREAVELILKAQNKWDELLQQFQ
ncbi:MAG TPA: HAD hydrolase family protein [Blastocatellia bacterium]|nr:HAD hydrolase family protein [Blastocatellia bacterium]